MAKLSELISKAAILSLGGFLFFYGLAGDQLPTVNAKLTEAEGWLADHTGFPSLVVAGATCSTKADAEADKEHFDGKYVEGGRSEEATGLRLHPRPSPSANT